jgi:hypothetical protein
MKKMYFMRMAAITMVACFTAFTAKVAAFSGTGSGVMEDPYVITTAEQLVEINDAPTAYYELGANIDLTDYISANSPTAGWMPLTPSASGAPFFSGTFDGKGYAITGLWMERPDLVGAGLFGRAEGEAIFQNLAIKTITPGIIGFEQVGGLLGAINAASDYGSDITIQNCCFEGDVAGRRAVGGLFGYNYKGILTLLNSYAGGTVIIQHIADGTNKVEAVGGLVGSGWNANTVNIINCYATNTVIAIAETGDYGENVGGLIGMQGNSGTVGNPSDAAKLALAKITIENSVAINPAVTSNGTAGRVHRIGGWIKGGATSTLTNNLALAVMETKDINGNVPIVSDDAGADGLDVSTDALRLRSTFEETLSFDFMSSWMESETAYPFPVLQTIRAENLPTDMPENLEPIFGGNKIAVQQAGKALILFDSSSKTVKIGNMPAGTEALVLDLTGRLVTSTTKSEIDLSGLSSGMYIVKVNSQSVKILK